jgi:hypothetical protein
MVAGGLAACETGLEPEPWNDTPVDVSLFSASLAGEIGRPSAYDVISNATVKLETPGSTGTFDIVLATEGNQLVLIPAGALQGQNSRAGIATITGQTFESLLKAPSDTAAYASTPVPIQAGGVYVVRTRRFSCSFTTAVNYAKIKVLAIDVPTGAASFSVVRNPYCNDRSFVPPED